jgi:cyclophilin family peptidyl-prolyl cis-trans isomerase
MGNLKIYDYSKEELSKFQYVKMTSSKGVMWLKLFVDEVPNTVANFATLVNDNFYNGLTFHRVILGFMAQGGCPNGTGTGGPNWNIPCETSLNTHTHEKGTLSMAHAGPDTGGSQFFICFANCPHLNGVHTVFGEIADDESLKVLDSIRQNDIMEKLEVFETKD